MTTNTTGKELESFPKDVVERARAIRERIVRLGIGPAKYKLNDPSRRRTAIGDHRDERMEDRHAVHLSPQ